jgi:two-component system response regulator NreC
MLIDGNEILREGVVSILSRHDDIEFVGSAKDEKEALRTLEASHPDVVLIGSAIKDISGGEIIREIRERFEGMHCILLTDAKSNNGNFLFEAINAGASGCFPMMISSEHFIKGIRAVFQGGTLLSPKDTTHILEQYHKLAIGTKEGNGALSFREREVVALMAKGLSNKQIAYKLQISTKTVKTHVAHIMKKFKAKNRTEAVVLAISRGLIAVEMDGALAANHVHEALS